VQHTLGPMIMILLLTSKHLDKAYATLTVQCPSALSSPSSSGKWLLPYSTAHRKAFRATTRQVQIWRYV